jgi:transcriptional regulator with PAS, ATPase and Fis domain
MTSKRQVDVVLEPIMQSKSMRSVDRVVRAVAHRDVIVSFVGESGTGKEVFARRMHDLSHRRAGPFIPINCAAIPESLFESELFGHEKGAFTGATERARGKLEAASGGTLFLDEIGEMPIGVQAKLLRFLENRKFMRVGGSSKIDVDARLVCATLRPLDAEVRAGRFRGDLYYRIQGITLTVPPLRDRHADIAPLVQQFVAQVTAKHGTRPPKIPRSVLATLQAYAWPGNVRELRNVVELVCLLRDGRTVRVCDLPEALHASARTPANPPAVQCKERFEVSLEDSLETTIDRVLNAALAMEGGNRSRAARRLGICLRTMQRHVARGMGPPSATRMARRADRYGNVA